MKVTGRLCLTDLAPAIIARGKPVETASDDQYFESPSRYSSGIDWLVKGTDDHAGPVENAQSRLDRGSFINGI